MDNLIAYCAAATAGGVTALLAEERHGFGPLVKARDAIRGGRLCVNRGTAGRSVALAALLPLLEPPFVLVSVLPQLPPPPPRAPPPPPPPSSKAPVAVAVADARVPEAVRSAAAVLSVGGVHSPMLFFEELPPAVDSPRRRRCANAHWWEGGTGGADGGPGDDADAAADAAADGCVDEDTVAHAYAWERRARLIAQTLGEFFKAEKTPSESAVGETLPQTPSFSTFVLALSPLASYVPWSTPDLARAAIDALNALTAANGIDEHADACLAAAGENLDAGAPGSGAAAAWIVSRLHGAAAAPPARLRTALGLALRVQAVTFSSPNLAQAWCALSIGYAAVRGASGPSAAAAAGAAPLLGALLLRARTAIGASHPTLYGLAAALRAASLPLLEPLGGAPCTRALARALRGDDGAGPIADSGWDVAVADALHDVAMASSAAGAAAALASLPTLLGGAGARAARHMRVVVRGCARAASGTGDARVAVAALAGLRAAAEAAPGVWAGNFDMIDAALSACASTTFSARSGALRESREADGGALVYGGVGVGVGVGAEKSLVAERVHAHAVATAATVAAVAPDAAAKWWAAALGGGGATAEAPTPALKEALVLLDKDSRRWGEAR